MLDSQTTVEGKFPNLQLMAGELFGHQTTRLREMSLNMCFTASGEEWCSRNRLRKVGIFSIIFNVFWKTMKICQALAKSFFVNFPIFKVDI